MVIIQSCAFGSSLADCTSTFWSLSDLTRGFAIFFYKCSGILRKLSGRCSANPHVKSNMPNKSIIVNNWLWVSGQENRCAFQFGRYFKK